MMARGKHAKASAARRDEARRQRLDALTAEVLAEADRCAVAEQRAVAADELTRRIHQRLAVRDSAVADEIDRLDAILDRLEGVVLSEETFERRIRAAWTRLACTVLGSSGGDAEAWERLLADTDVNDRSTVLLGVQRRGMPAHKVKALQRARGYRRSTRQTARPAQTDTTT